MRLRFEAVEELLRDVIEGASDGCVGQVRERDARIAVPGQLGIERDGPKAGDVEARRVRREKERLDRVAVAAVVAAHVLDVTEDAMGSLRQRRHGARDHAPGDLGRDRHQQERRPGPEIVGVLDGPLGSRRQIEQQQIERSPLKGPKDLAEERELLRGAPRMRLPVRRALDQTAQRLLDELDREPRP